MNSQSTPVRSFAGASILIVGATGVLGSHLSQQLGALGAKLTLTGRNATKLAELSGLIPGSAAIRADIRDSSTAEKLIDVATAHGGKLDGVMIASGVVAFGELAGVDPVTVEELFLTNAIAPLWVMQRALESLTATSGFIAAISGVVAERPMPNMAAYSASKAALASALTAVAMEAKKRKVAVIDARPPHTETGLATRPLDGTAPRMPVGLDPAAVARRILEGIAAGETELASSAFV